MTKTIYGLVQAARAFYKKLSNVLKQIGFEASLVDPCLMTKRCKTGDVYIGLYVDDCYCCGHQDDIKAVILEMKNHGFELKIEQEMHDYLSCKIEFSKDRQNLDWSTTPDEENL